MPEASLRILREGKILKVWDILRKKYLILTPEEYVRQRFVHWLVHHLHYPTTHLANEIGIELNGTKKRCDTVLFDRQGCPLGIFEFKAPDILITQKVFDQILRYNSVLR
ncbi:MAG: type I restriction enzyme HsdR N-terminal domain-containing protein, partial [Muribaculaceae bacterium]|nr:type I restriction enzyme HsdR N-terminal domain-containing protein [Muribaculaceae bacterium]